MEVSVVGGGPVELDYSRVGFRAEDADKETSRFDSNHCFEGFIFGFREIIVMEQK